MMLRRRWLARAAAVIGLCLLVGGGYALPKAIRIGAGHYVKMMCSGLFLSKRGVKALVDKEIAADLNGWLEEYVPVIDRARGAVEASLFGMGTTRAIYREGLGCTVLSGASEDAVRRQLTAPIRRDVAGSPAALWPEGDRVDLAALPPRIDRERLSAAMREAFHEPQPRRLKRTRAVVVVHKGRIVAEAYGQTFTSETPMMGWGLAQGATNALVGHLVQEGKLRLDARKLLPEWSDADDPKSRISLDHLMRMTSGLAFDQSDKALVGDLFPMLYTQVDTAAFAAAKPLDADPGTRWAFSSGTTNIVSRLIRDLHGEALHDYLSFPYRALFDRIGMRSAVLETDASGTFVGSHFLYATARDWARLGLLFLKNGVWRGERLLPEDWVRYSVTPAPGSNGRFGAHFWLKVPEFMRPSGAPRQALPSDAFYSLGFGGQMIAVIPSRDLVLFRSGIGRYRGAWDPERFVAGFLEAFPALD